MENGKQPQKDLKQAYRVSYLLAGHIKKSLTEAERKELEEWIAENEHNRKLFEELTGKEHVEKNLKYYQQPDIEKNLLESKKNLQFNPSKKGKWLGPVLLIAASILLLAVLIWYFKPFSAKEQKNELANNTDQELLPANGRAVLTLNDGQKIVLPSKGKDSVINTQVSVSGNNTELSYTGSGNVEYHTLTVPAGSTYKVKLADGTLVHLNSMSSIRYPTAFTGGIRKVLVTGEAYFEVVHDEKKPFIVEAGDLLIKDLGTAFNINAYADEPEVNATLIAGSISVYAGKGTPLLVKPGEQAILSPGGVTVNKNIDTTLVLAWKNDQFRFVNTPVHDIMRQVERWYDAEVVYEDSTNVHLNATIERNVPVSRLLHLLSATEDVHFKINGRKIIVSK